MAAFEYQDVAATGLGGDGGGGGGGTGPYARLDDYVLQLIDVSDESQVTLKSPPLWKLIFFLTMVSSCLIGSLFKGVIYKHILGSGGHNLKDRPINVLILVSAVVHHVTQFSVALHLTATLVFDIAPGDIFGRVYCDILMVFECWGLVYGLTTGTLGIAIYRVLYIKRDVWVKYHIGETRLLLIILFVGFVVNSLVPAFLFYDINIDHTYTRFAHNLCIGLSDVQVDTLIEYQVSRGIDMHNVTMWKRLAIAIKLSMTIMEICCYIVFCHHCYKIDNASRLLPTRDVRRSNVRNATTFLGQFYSFIVETAFLIFFAFLVSGAVDYNYGSVMIAASVHCNLLFAVLSMVEVMTSPPLRSQLLRMF